MNLAFWLENWLKQLSSDEITQIFTWVLCIVFISAFLLFIPNLFTVRKENRRNQFLDSAPVLLTSIGILGTFGGIVAGLLNFDINNIDGSISTLLGGMKTAFLTSVIGVFLSIVLKLIYNFERKATNRHKQSYDIKAIIDTFYQQAEYQNQQLLLAKEWQSQSKKIIENFEHFPLYLKSAIAYFDSHNEFAKQIMEQLKAHHLLIQNQQSIFSQFEQRLTQQLNTQIELTQSGVNYLTENNQLNRENQIKFEQFDQRLQQQLQQFAEMLSESATKQVIQALETVIRDFNAQLTEQFGQNFKELNSAVHLLVQWQENYKQQLAEMTEQYQLGVQSIDASKSAMLSIEQSSAAIPESMEKLGEVININQQQVENLQHHLESFALLRERAIEAVPQIHQHIETMLDNMTNATQHLTQNLHKNSEVLATALVNSSEHLISHTTSSHHLLTETLSDIQGKNKAMTQHLTEVIGTIADKSKNIEKDLIHISQQLNQNAEKWQKEFSENASKIQTTLVESINDIIKQQQNENGKIISGLNEVSKNSLEEIRKHIELQLQTIDKSAEQEVNRIMTQMAEALVTITNRFTQDYEKLVRAMINITNYRG